MGKTILVTGATGYLGSHLVRHYLGLGDRVIILKRSFSDCHRLVDVMTHLESHNLDQATPQEILGRVGVVDAVIHTATCYGRRRESLATLLAANTHWPLALLEAAHVANVPIFINTDTSLDRNLNGYALSKAQFRDWGAWLSRDRPNGSFINLRLEHFVGPGDDPSKFVAYLIHQCMQPVERLELTPGEQQRDFVDISDVVRAYDCVLTHAHTQHWTGLHDYDVGSGETVTIRQVAEMVKALTHSPTELLFGAKPYRPGEVMRAVADVVPWQGLGWQPQYTAAQAIERTVAASLAAHNS